MKEAHVLSRRRAPRSARRQDPLFEVAAIALLVLLIYFVFAA